MRLKLSSGVFACAALLCAGGAYADGISPDDAHVTVGRDGPDPMAVKGLFFDTVDSAGGGRQTFFNSTNQDIVELIFTAVLVKNDNIKCDAADLFGTCTVSCDNNLLGHCKAGETVTITFSDPLSGGIPPQGEFFIDLNEPGMKDGGNWRGDLGDRVSTLTVVPVFAPEPGSLLLVLTGLGGASLFRRARRS